MRGEHKLRGLGPAPLALTALATLALATSCAPSPDPGKAEPEPRTQTSPEPAVFEAQDQASHTESRLQAVSAVDARIVWASGLDGTYTVTRDGGKTWRTSRGVDKPDSETLQFRDIHAFDDNTAYLLSAGYGDVSRIYKTTNGGAAWELQFINLEPEGFLDCFDFWDSSRGIAYGDSVQGELFVLTTRNGSAWSRVPATALPPAGEVEGGFAASGTCVETGPAGRAWIATGAGGNARVLTTDDYGETWSFADTPTVRGTAAGLMSVVFRSESQGVALGGDLEQPDAVTANVAITNDGGASWTAGGSLTFFGAVYGGAWGGASDGSGDGSVLIAAGPGGLSSSIDSGLSWQALGSYDTWAVDFGDDDTFWAVGSEGRITRFERVP